MKYEQPFDQPGAPNASYVNGNPATGTPGSIPSAAAFENHLRELVNLITFSGITPSAADLQQIARAIQNNLIRYGVDTGATNALTVTLSPVPLSIPAGFLVCVKAAHTNTTATSLNVNSTGQKPCVHFDGSAFRGGEIVIGGLYIFMFDGTSWQLINDFTGPTLSPAIVFDRKFSALKIIIFFEW